MGSGIFPVCLFTLLSFVALTTAQCSEGFDVFGYPIDCVANSDPTSPDYLQILIIKEAGDCEDNTNIDAKIIFTGLDGQVTSAVAINPGPNLLDPTYYLDFNIPLSAIPNGATVTQIHSLADLVQPNKYPEQEFTVFFTQTHTPTLFIASTTVTIPTYVLSTSTTTSLVFSSSTSTITPPTSTDTIATGTETVHTVVTSTSTITITQKPTTYTTHPVVYSTTTLPCLGPSKRKKARSHVQAIENRQGAAGIPGAAYSPPLCGSQSTTTVSTTTFLSTSTSTIVIPDTILSTSTVTTTTTLPTPTSYLFVEDTTTSTKTKTKDTWTVTGGGIVIVTKDITITATVYASTDKHGRPVVCTSTKAGLVGAAIGKPTSKSKHGT